MINSETSLNLIKILLYFSLIYIYIYLHDYNITHLNSWIYRYILKLNNIKININNNNYYICFLLNVNYNKKEDSLILNVN